MILNNDDEEKKLYLKIKIIGPKIEFTLKYIILLFGCGFSDFGP